MLSLPKVLVLQTDTIDTSMNHPNIKFKNLGGDDDFVEGSPDTAVFDYISQAQGTIVVESCPFKLGTIKLPPNIAFQVHLLSQLQARQGNDLNKFNQVMECVKKMLLITASILSHWKFCQGDSY
jgi:hypothetical protein